MDENNFFIYRDKSDGNIAIGKIPEEYEDLLTEIQIEWKQNILDKNLLSSTHHEWYYDLTYSLKQKIDTIRNMELWKSLCDENNNKCKKNDIIYVPEMDELYYFNLKSDIPSGRLYGAFGNVEPHIDTARLFEIEGLTMYRVLIGLSDFNKTTSTKFPKANMEKKINKNDYVVFDFNRTLHQVIKKNKISNPRYLLKLHFIVCENYEQNSWKVKLFKKCHMLYEKITRYVMDEGTDPEKWTDFFWGLIMEIDPLIYIVSCLIALYFIVGIFKIKNTIEIVKYIICFVIVLYLFIVTLFWLRYQLTGYR
jgi:hypothetical protein